MRRRLAIGVAGLIVLGGCGSSDSGTPGGVPAALLGKYTTELNVSDQPAGAPRELTDGSMRWTLTIAKSGGIDGGPVFGIANSRLGPLENPSFSVKDDLLLLRHEECAAGPKPFYDNRYRYKLSGKTLTLTKVENQCRDQVALTILTSRPWTKVN
jgi:hypothetical protein